MRQLQNDQEKIGSFYQNHRSNIPPDSAFTYGLINNAGWHGFDAEFSIRGLIQYYQKNSNEFNYIWRRWRPPY